MPNIQFLFAYNLVFIFHKDNSAENTKKYKKIYNILIYRNISNYSYYAEILKKLIEEEEKENDINTQFLNK